MPARRTLTLILGGGLAAVALAAVIAALLRDRPPSGGGPPLGGWMRNFTPSAERPPAPVLSLRDRAGGAVGLDGFRGRVVVVNFWASWCVPCVRELPSLDRLARARPAERLAVLAVSEDRDGWEVMTPFLGRLGLADLAAYHDPGGAAAAALKVASLPTTILFDQTGREIGRLVGLAEWDSPEAVALIDHYAKGF